MLSLEIPSRYELVVITQSPNAPDRGAVAAPAMSPIAPVFNMAGAANEHVFAPTLLAEQVEALGAVLKPGVRNLPAPYRAAHFNAINPAAPPDAFGDANGEAENDNLEAPLFPDLSIFYRVSAPQHELEKVAAELNANPLVQAVYIQPPTELPSLNNMLPTPVPPPGFTPDYSVYQGHLKKASQSGIDAQFAWDREGGKGEGVSLIDIEQSWNLAHEDLKDLSIPLFGGAPRVGADPSSRDHGTAVVGITSAVHNNFGVKGICPAATMSTISNAGGLTVADTIILAANKLRAGDILILEMHRPGPRFNYDMRPDQLGFIAIEWWPLELAAIQYATAKGVIVMEAAGNGAQNLDDPLYDANPGFGPNWRNPFTRKGVDSGAILIGAGAPPSGIYGPVRSRLDFSNYGASLDAQGWGREVTTSGYGVLQGGPNENLFYTNQFSGTSSATPIVAGAIACVQGVLRAQGKTPLTPAEARRLLRTSGSLQKDGLQHPVTGVVTRPRSERIGNLPNLQALIPAALALRP